MAHTPRQPIRLRDVTLSVLFALGIVWFGYLIWGIFEKEERARTEVNETKAQLSSLKDREAKLQGDLDTMQTERGKEAALRDVRGVARPGEEVIIVVPAATTTPGSLQKSWWRRVLEWF